MLSFSLDFPLPGSEAPLASLDEPNREMLLDYAALHTHHNINDMSSLVRTEIGSSTVINLLQPYGRSFDKVSSG